MQIMYSTSYYDFICQNAKNRNGYAGIILYLLVFFNVNGVLLLIEKWYKNFHLLNDL